MKRKKFKPPREVGARFKPPADTFGRIGGHFDPVRMPARTARPDPGDDAGAPASIKTSGLLPPDGVDYDEWSAIRRAERMAARRITRTCLPPR